MAVYSTIQEVKAKQTVKTSLFDDDEQPKITLRKEQKKAVADALRQFKKKTGNKFLWNAKMRFGKTVCALQLAREMGQLEGDSKVRRTIIVTHRPVVNANWKEDFNKIFFDIKDEYRYGTKFEDSEEGNFYDLERQVDKNGKHYVFFASMQYLRRSTLVGGDNDEQLKMDILNNPWDLVVIDEAHEGTRTSLGQRVIQHLTNGKPNTKVLHLSGTPFNLYDDFVDEEIFTWDYIKEQQAKRDWSKENPKEPAENNPYRDLPEMEIRTYNLGKLVKLGDGATFSFKDFFQVWTGNPKNDSGKQMPEGKKGRFIREQAVIDFLDLLCKDDEKSHYPFSNDEYREMFNHTLWVVPGVKEAKALETLLKEHELFGEYFDIINVAGNNDDDETRSDALNKVKERIGDKPMLTQTITISCGRLTTGVTVKPWTAVFYLKGSENTSAATYMQTIFRVQSPYTYEENGVTKMKTKCYVFDFAPDRSIKMVAETAKFATLTQKERQVAQATSREKDIKNMEDFLSFCPVISMEGGEMVKFEAERLFEQLEHVYVDRVVRNGFNDNSLYDIRELLSLSPEEVQELDGLGVEIAKSTNMEKPKRAVDISKSGMSSKQKEAAKRAKEKEKQGLPLTPEEQAAKEAEKKRREEERKERDNRITILRGISLRIPLLMYGATIEDEEEGITIDNFTEQVDPASWAEFMPRGVDKRKFNAFKKCYNPTVFAAAGKRYRQLAREADAMHTDERVKRIAEIFSYFHNPDKETVLTPWRVVNMHMSDCLGGYCFFNERFDGPNQKEVVGTNGKLFDWIDTTEPRFVNRGKVTADVFGSKDCKILEINSKTGLYPLYVTYSLYRSRMKDFVEAGLIEDIENYSVEEEQVVWDDILRDNIFVICNTRMAASITRRTLCGFREMQEGYTNIKNTKLIERATNERDALVKEISRLSYWKKGAKTKDMIKFSAVVGNPPYQDNQSTNNCTTNKAFASAVYPTFIDLSTSLKPQFVSLITPSRWMTKTGQGIDSDWVDKMINSNHFIKIHDFYDALDCFNGVEIKGGVNYFLFSGDHNGKCELVLHHNKKITCICEKLNGHGAGIVIRDAHAIEIYSKIKKIEGNYILTKSFSSLVSPQHFFDKSGLLTTSWTGYSTTKNDAYSIKYYLNKQVESCGYAWIKLSDIPKNADVLPLHKVFISKAYNGGDAFPHQIIGKPFYGEPNSVCSQTYLVIGYEKERNLSKEICDNIIKYMCSSFFRYLVFIKKKTQDNPSSVFEFVPLQDFTANSDIDWSKSVEEIDQQLYAKYHLTTDERQFIETMIKPME